MARKHSHIELGMGYGIVVGGAAGIVLLAVTGSAMSDPSPMREPPHRPGGHEGGS